MGNGCAMFDLLNLGHDRKLVTKAEKGNVLDVLAIDRCPQFCPSPDFLDSHVRGLISSFCGAYMLFPLSLMYHLHRPGRLRWPFQALGESLFDFLTFLLMILAVFTSISSLCMSLHSIDLSAMLPRPSASSMCRHFAPVGEFGVFGPALHRFDHCARACACPMHLRGFQASLASLRVSVLLPGEFGVFEVF